MNKNGLRGAIYPEEAPLTHMKSSEHFRRMSSLDEEGASMINISQAVCVERIIASDYPQISGIFAAPLSANRGRSDAPLIADFAIFEMGRRRENYTTILVG